MSLRPDDLVLVHVKASSGYHKIIDQWEDKQYQVPSQLDDQPVFQVQPVDPLLMKISEFCIGICYFLYRQLQTKI